MGGRVAGIDEAGRGPWAGPVVAAAVVLNQSKMPDELRFGIKDSKVISSAKRECLFSLLRLHAEIGIGRAEVSEIDETNILSATFMAMKRALQALSISVYGWEKNAGYGTKEHREALERIGVTPHHRKTFSPIAKIMSKF